MLVGYCGYLVADAHAVYEHSMANGVGTFTAASAAIDRKSTRLNSSHI